MSADAALPRNTPMAQTTRIATLLVGLFLAFSMVAVGDADARRGGSFGSRGMRTYQSAPPTRTAPQPTAPIERSTTPNTGQNNPARQTQMAPQQRPSFMNGFGGSMLRGLILGGLIGLLLGSGFGGLAGMLGLILQALLIGGVIMLLLRAYRSRQSTASALAGSSGDARGFADENAPRPHADDTRSFGLRPEGSRSDSGLGRNDSDEIRLTQDDLDTFERRLAEVQEAFGREDHAALRPLATPEMVSYLSEELAENAKNGVKNDVTDVRLLQADIAEAWREGDSDYATAAMLYSSRDVTRERIGGRVVAGADRPTETTELWTFTRREHGDWKLSAIQQVS
jgi:predicted lipid-binding transport protein (Tim44 family)